LSTKRYGGSFYLQAALTSVSHELSSLTLSLTPSMERHLLMTATQQMDEATKSATHHFDVMRATTLLATWYFNEGSYNEVS
jgi:hypothetical protein